MATTDELAGVEIAGDAKEIRTRLMKLTQGNKLPSFWAPKKGAWNLPKGVRPWRVFEKKPEIAQIIHDEKLTNLGRIHLRYFDGTDLVLMLDDFARCGRVIVDKSTITKIFTLRSPGQRDLHGHDHG